MNLRNRWSKSWGALALALAIVGGPALARAQDDAEKPAPAAGDEKKAGSITERVKAVIEDYDEAQQAAYEAYAKAKPEDKNRVYFEKLPKVADYAKRLWPIVEEEPSDPGVARALSWIISADRGEGESSARAFDLILAHHIDSDAAGDAAQSLMYASGPAVLNFLQRVLDESESTAAQGKACYALAQVTRRSVRGGSEEERERAEAKSEKLFERVVAEFGDTPLYRGMTMGEKAKADLFEIRNLGIGQVAPDISGEDIDGVAFKLSDYRGKVVLLDFWGDW